MNATVLLFRIKEQKKKLMESPMQTFVDYQTIKLLDDIESYINEQKTKDPVFQEGISCQHIINNGEMNITI